ncbi:methyltransferase [Acrocarpospora phusangensis]|uniref:Methyltransferase n=1 Tax=Acrocarpospora phusangensis TaxID=1070424 RepID=A0A919QCQ9_9ACTN|nr:HemK2/MTQ2 family protein methyltransferase [Acrocarpospora phusangensis]GIH24960.1 methyltransferase [Acrocarpospora phusangensis]
MFLLRPPGVYRPQGDTALLAAVFGLIELRPGAEVLDVGTGTGAMAVVAAQRAGVRVTAVDRSMRAVLAARFNTLIRGLGVRVVHGDLFTPLNGQVFDLIVANPPYVPGNAAAPSAHSRARAWDAGLDGRGILDRVCSLAPAHLADGGSLLMVHSALNGVDASLRRLREAGLTAFVVARRREHFGPVMRARRRTLQLQGLLGPGHDDEELVVIRADKSDTATRRQAV